MPLIPTTRRQFLYRSAAASTLAIAGDSLLLEPNVPRVVRQDFWLPRWPERMNGFTIALLSDFHYDPYFSIHPLRAAIPIVNGLRPHLIVLTGDFVSVSLTGNGAMRRARRRTLCSPPPRNDRAPWPLGGLGKS